MSSTLGAEDVECVATDEAKQTDRGIGRFLSPEYQLMEKSAKGAEPVCY